MNVLLCDDHPVYREGLRLLLAEVGVDVVAEAATGEQAVELVAETQPDVVVMDLHLPGISGVEATRQIVRRHPDLPVLVLTMLDDDATLFAALRAGARGYLLKGASYQDVARALDAVRRGETLIGATLTDKLRAGLDRQPAAAAFSQLTRRENEILDLIARGRTNAEIAAALVVSEKTVRNVVSSVLAKLGVSSRAEAVARARDGGVGA